MSVIYRGVGSRRGELVSVFVKRERGDWYTSSDGRRWYSSSSSRSAKDAQEHAELLWCVDRVKWGDKVNAS